MPRPPEELRDFISYDRDAGTFTWVVTSSNRIARAGSRADKSSPSGYRRICFSGAFYSAHRVAWWIETGDWPDLQIDHKNRVKDDNRFSNLRLATSSQNAANARCTRALPKGVTLHRQTGKYQAQIRCEGRDYYLGLHSTADAAHDAYVANARRLFGEFASTG